jgi:hypothetical protein
MTLFATQQSNLWALFIIGVIFILFVLVLAFFDPNPTGLRYVIYRILLSFGAAAIVAVLPGSIGIQLPTGVTAGGALAVFVLVYFFDPVGLPRMISNAF